VSLVEYAEKELRLAGLFDEDSDYGGMLGIAVLDLIKLFSDQGHSGFSAGMTVSIFDRLAQYKPLTPITDNPNEWVDHGEGIWQSTRDSEAFSDDGGKTYKLLSDNTTMWASEPYDH
jgi:hypothetical protein